MSDTHTRLVQGGITQSPDSASSPLVAATFTHRLLPERTIVRLVPEPLLEAESVALGVAGLEPGGCTPVGHTLRRAIGFPAWPILNDPDNAQHAVNLIADLERAAKRAHSKPRAVRNDIKALEATLDASAPHFLPTFLEEVGRIFLTAGSTAYASQMFTKARDVERRHALPIDEDRHQAVILEFACSGALAAKEITAEAKRLSDLLESDEAYERFRTLCLERVRGGLAPYAGMKKDLATLAKAAGMKPAEEEVRMAADLLRVTSIQRAGHSFWKKYDKAIRTAASNDEALQDRLLAMTPTELTVDDWLEILDDTGASKLVTEGKHPDFIHHIIKLVTKYRRVPNDSWAKIGSFVADILPGSGCTSLSISRTKVGMFPAELWEHLLSHDVAINFFDDEEDGVVNLFGWANSDNRIPLPHLAASEEMRDLLVDGIESSLNSAFRHFSSDHEMLTVACDPHLKPLVIEVLEEPLKQLESAPVTVFRLIKATEAIVDKVHIPDPDVQAVFDRLRAYHRNRAEVLAETLRRGILEELGWPLYEHVCSDVAAESEHEQFFAQDFWPEVAVHNDQKVVFLRGDSTTEIHNWTDAPIRGVAEVDHHYALVTQGDSSFGYNISWSDSSGKMAANEYRCGSSQDLSASVPVPGGRLIDDQTIIRPGGSTWNKKSAKFFVEGERIWIVNGMNVCEIDPETGEVGDNSLPNWFEEQCRRHPGLVFRPFDSQLRPAHAETANSHFSTADGYHRHAVFRKPNEKNYYLVVDADGTEYEARGELANRFCGVIRLPDGQPRLLVTQENSTLLLDPADSTPTLYYGTEFESAMWWHHADYRDTKFSARLRVITAEELQPVIQRISELHSEDPQDTDGRMADAVGEILGVEDYGLRHGVAQQAHALVASWPGWNSPPPTEVLVGTPTVENNNRMLRSVRSYPWGAKMGLMYWHAAAKLGLHDRTLPDTHITQWTSYEYGWLEFVDCADALLALAAVPGRTVEEIQALKEIWVVLREAKLLEASHLTVETLKSPQDTLSEHLKFPPLTLRFEVNHNSDIMLMRADGGGPIDFKGNSLELLDSQRITPSRTDLEPVFDALIEQVQSNGPRKWTPEAAEDFATVSGAPLTDAQMIMAGFPNFFVNFGYQKDDFLPSELRREIGIKIADAVESRKRLKEASGHFLHVLAAGVPADAASVVDQGLDAHAMGTYWSEYGPAKKVEKPTDELLEKKPEFLPEATLHNVLAGKHDAEDWSVEVAAVLWLASELDLSDPRRQFLADYAEKLMQSPSKPTKISLGAIGTYAETCRHLNLPNRDLTDPNEPLFHTERFATEQGTRHPADKIIIDVSDITDINHPDLQQAFHWGILAYGELDKLAAFSSYLNGGLSAYAQWLRHPGTGEPHDPLAVAPDLVETVALTLRVSIDAARYYLQLLALPEPTDANVRRWNEWKKPAIGRAGEELAEAGVVVKAKRPRAGRNFFLPGGWAEATPPHLPIENWKLEPFGFVKIAANATYEPMFCTALAPLPPAEWFTACWERSQGDDAPRFAELTTTKRSRR